MTHGLDNFRLGNTKPEGEDCRDSVDNCCEKSYFCLGVVVVRYPSYLCYYNQDGDHKKKWKSVNGRPEGEMMWNSSHKSNNYYHHYVNRYFPFFHLLFTLLEIVLVDFVIFFVMLNGICFIHFFLYFSVSFRICFLRRLKNRISHRFYVIILIGCYFCTFLKIF